MLNPIKLSILSYSKNYKIKLIGLLVLCMLQLANAVYAQNISKEDARMYLEEKEIIIDEASFCSAVSQGAVEAVALLHLAGIDINTRCDADRAPVLQVAVDYGHYRVFNYLLANNVDLEAGQLFGQGSTPLLRAISHKRYDMVFTLLRVGAPAHQRPGQVGDTSILAYALLVGCDPTLIMKLLNANASVNELYWNDNTPLMDAASKGCTEVVEIFLEAGANVLATNKIGSTALHSAVSSGKMDMVLLLMKAGADPSIKNRNDETPMFLAASSKNKFLLEIIQDFKKINDP